MAAIDWMPIFAGIGGGAALICGWFVWRFIIIPSCADEVKYPLSKCDTSMYDMEVEEK